MSNLLDGTQDGDQLGRYRLVAALGQGGMGRIYLAVTSGLGEFRKLLVVKELQQELASNDKFIEMFLAEAKLAARLNHPNIVQTIEAGEEHGRYFLSMEFLDGQPLTELLKRASVEPAVTLGTRLAILCEVLSGLEYAHELCDFDGTPFEIVHRDITPHNVFVTYHGQVKIVDFGIAKAVDVESLTNAGVFKGKFAYAAPEQVRGEDVDQRCDLFAVGVMLWEAIAMKRYAPGQPTKASVERRLRGLEPRISEVMPTVEPALAEICDRALHIDREQRFSSAVEFRAALQRYLLVSGEDPQPIGALLCEKFGAERTAMHRKIDAYTKRDDRNQSVVRNLSTMAEGLPHLVASQSDGPTRVGNLSKLIESSRVDNPIPGELAPFEWSGSLRGRNKWYPWIAAGLALIGAVFLIVRMAEDRPAKPPHLTMPAPPPEPTVARPETTLSPVATPPTPAESPFANVRNGEPSPATPPPSASTSAPRDGSEERSAKQWHMRPASKSSASTSAHSRESGLASASEGEVAEPTSTGASTVTRNPYRTSTPSPVSAPGSGSANGRTIAGTRSDIAASQSSTARPTMGSDLRSLPRRSQRPIDMQDPFR